MTQGTEPPSTSSPSIFAPASWTPSVLCWPLAQPKSPSHTHLLLPKLKPHKDDPDNGFRCTLLGLWWGRMPGDLGWNLAGLPVLQNSQVGHSRPERSPHIGSWGLAGPIGEEQGGLQPSSGKQYGGLTGRKAVAICRRQGKSGLKAPEALPASLALSPGNRCPYSLCLGLVASHRPPRRGLGSPVSDLCPQPCLGRETSRKALPLLPTSSHPTALASSLWPGRGCP